jgi:hypothetical protein
VKVLDHFVENHTTASREKENVSSCRLDKEAAESHGGNTAVQSVLPRPAISSSVVNNQPAQPTKQRRSVMDG